MRSAVHRSADHGGSPAAACQTFVNTFGNFPHRPENYRMHSKSSDYRGHLWWGPAALHRSLCPIPRDGGGPWCRPAGPASGSAAAAQPTGRRKRRPSAKNGGQSSASSWAYTSLGRVRATVVPSPTVLVNSSLAPKAAAMSAQRASPTPLPPLARARALSTR